MLCLALSVMLAAAPTPVPGASPTASPRIAKPVDAIPAPGGVKTVSLVVHAPSAPAAVALAKNVGDTLAASGIEVRTGVRLIERIVDASPVDPFAGVRRHIEAASKSYLTLQLAQADSQLRAAEEALVPIHADPEAVAWTRRILELRAVVLMAQDRVDASTEKLSALFLLDPEYRADERFLSPQFAPAFENAAAEAALAPRGTVTVRSDPPGADVYVDGKPVGIAPVTLDLRAGQHVVQALLVQRAPAGVAVRVDPKVPGELTLSLPPLDAAAEKAALARSIMTGVLPGARAQIATEIRELARTDAVAVLLARASMDGTLLSGEVHWDDPRIPPSRTPEFRLTSVASANARALASGLEKILRGPKPEPVIWRGRYIPPEVSNPFRLQLAIGRVDNYGTGWSKTDLPNNLISATFNASGIFRSQEEKHVALDYVVSVGFISASRCYGGGPEDCSTVTSNQAFLDVHPRLDFRWRRYSAFGGGGFGIGNHTMTYQQTSDFPVRTDTIVVARAFVTAGVGIGIGKRARIAWEEKIATAQGTFPTTIGRTGGRDPDYEGPKHLNVGGITHQLAISYRF